MGRQEFASMPIDCAGCGLPIERDERATAAMVAVRVLLSNQYNEKGPYHAACGNRLSGDEQERLRQLTSND